MLVTGKTDTTQRAWTTLWNEMFGITVYPNWEYFIFHDWRISVKNLPSEERMPEAVHCYNLIFVIISFKKTTGGPIIQFHISAVDNYKPEVIFNKQLRIPVVFGMQFWSIYHVLCLCGSMYPASMPSISQHAKLCIAFWLDIVIPFILYFIHGETEKARKGEILWGKWQMFTQSIALDWKVKCLWDPAAWTFELDFLMEHSIMFNR